LVAARSKHPQEGSRSIPETTLRVGLRRCQPLREVLAKKVEKTGSVFAEAHFGHLIRLRLRSAMPIVNEDFFLHSLQRKSYVGMQASLQLLQAINHILQRHSVAVHRSARRSALAFATHPKGPSPTLSDMRHAFALKGFISVGLVRADAPSFPDRARDHWSANRTQDSPGGGPTSRIVLIS